MKSNWCESVLHGSHVCRHRSRAVPHATASDAVDDAVHDAFMTLAPYTRIKEGEGHELGRGVRNGSRSARSTPCPNQAGALSGKVQPLQRDLAAGSRIPWAETFQDYISMGAARFA